LALHLPFILLKKQGVRNHPDANQLIGGKQTACSQRPENLRQIPRELNGFWEQLHCRKPDDEGHDGHDFLRASFVKEMPLRVATSPIIGELRAARIGGILRKL
jgi:hypothetical protein